MAAAAATKTSASCPLSGAVFLVACVSAAVLASATPYQVGEAVSFKCLAKNKSQLKKVDWFWTNQDGKVNLKTDPIEGVLITKNKKELTSTLSIPSLKPHHDGYYSSTSGRRMCTNDFVSVHGDLANSSRFLMPVSEADRQVKVPSGGESVIPCRRAFPEVVLTLDDVDVTEMSVEKNLMYYDPGRGIVIENGSLDKHHGERKCRGEYEGEEEEIIFHLMFSFGGHASLDMPQIEGNSTWSLNDSQTLTCSVKVDPDKVDFTEVFWKFPNENSSVIQSKQTNTYSPVHFRVIVSRNLTLPRVRMEDGGNYECEAKQHAEDQEGLEIRGTQKDVVVLPLGGVHWDYSGFNPVVTVSIKDTAPVYYVVKLRTTEADANLLDFRWLDPQGREIDVDDKKYSLTINHESNTCQQLVLTLLDVQVADMGRYVLEVWMHERKQSSLSMTLEVLGPPVVTLGNKPASLVYLEELPNFFCNVTSFPMSETTVEVQFLPCSEHSFCLPFEENRMTLYTSVNGTTPDSQFLFRPSPVAENNSTRSTFSSLPISAHRRHDSELLSGQLSCTACNAYPAKNNCTTDTLSFLVNDVPEPLKIEEPENTPDYVTYTCHASRLIYGSISWEKRDPVSGDMHRFGLAEDESSMIQDSFNSYSLTSQLSFPIHSNYGGVYRCRGFKSDHSRQLLEHSQMDPESFPDDQLIHVKSEPLRAPVIVSEDFNQDVMFINKGDNVTLHCLAVGHPPPRLQWYKDGLVLPEETSSKLHIRPDQPSGKPFSSLFGNSQSSYKCVAKNSEGQDEKEIMLQFQSNTRRLGTGPIVSIAVLCFVGVSTLIGCIVCYYRKKLKRTKSQIPRRDIEAFKNGDPKGLEAIKKAQQEDEQYALRDPAHYSLVANSHMLPYDEKYEVPWDMLDLGTQIGAGAYGRVYRAQARNIITPGETSIVAVKTLKHHPEVEHLKALMSELKMLIYIGKHERLLNLLGACTERLKDRELFIILEYCPLGSLTDVLRKSKRYFRPEVKEASISNGGARLISPGNQSTGRSEAAFFRTSRNSPVPPQDHSGMSQFSVPPPNSSSDATTASLSPSHYLKMVPIDSRDDVTALTMGDLLIWSLHVAEGMSYLANKKVLHGDLASRNILIAENGTAKISDFGLARNIYHMSTYKKSGNSALPVKWMAPESINEMLFSTQSDVWSYGILLWEVFSLGGMPYPGIQPGPKFLESINRGERMKCPEHAPPDIYNLMLSCWQQTPEDRISFDRLVHILQRRLRDSSTFHELLVDNFNYLHNLEQSSSVESRAAAELDPDGYLRSVTSPPPEMTSFRPDVLVDLQHSKNLSIQQQQQWSY